MDKQQRTMLFNPYSGKPRDPRDIASDPAGLLMVDPDEPLYAAPKAQPPSASDECEALTAEERTALRVILKVVACGVDASDDSIDECDPDFIKVGRRAHEALQEAVQTLVDLPDERFGLQVDSERGAWAMRRLLSDAAPSPAASADEWMAEAEKLADDCAHAFVKAHTCKREFTAAYDARAALLAHLKARP